MKHISFFILFLFVTTGSIFGQLTKGHWLVGGTGSIDSYKRDYSANSSQGTYASIGQFTEINLSPNVGYFLADKLAAGIIATYSSMNGKITQQTNVNMETTRSHSYLVGLFGRYYFLDKDNRTNILLHSSYQRGVSKEAIGTYNIKSNMNDFIIAAGPVIYFNSSVGIEFLMGYKAQGEEYTSAFSIEKKRGFLLTIGLQIHLGND